MANPFDQFDDTQQTQSANPFDKFDESPIVVAPTPQDNPSFMDRNRANFDKRLDNAMKIRQNPNMSGVERAIGNAGQGMGMVADIPMEAVKSGMSIIPDFIKNAVTEAPMSFLGGQSLKQTGENLAPIMGAIGQGYNKLEQVAPRVTNVLNAAGNTLNLGGFMVGGVTNPTFKTGRVGASPTINVIKSTAAKINPVKTVTKIDEMIDQSIINGYTKGIKPTVVGKSNANLVSKAKENAITAVRDIAANVKTPLSQSKNILEEFSNAVSSTKKKIWQEATQLASDAGEQGAKVDILPVIDDMRAVKADVLAQAADPQIASAIEPYLNSWENLVKSKGPYLSPAEAEDLITGLNNKAKPFWKDTNTHSSAASIERIAQNLRKQTFDAMEGMQGDVYQNLRKRYGAQLAIEKEVTNRATINGRKANYGFFDIANIPIAGEFVSSLMSGNVKGILKSAAMGGAKIAMKLSNDPSNIIRKMFKNVETLEALKADKLKSTVTVKKPNMDELRTMFQQRR